MQFLRLLCLFAVAKSSAGFSKKAHSRQSTSRWGPMDLGLGEAGDIAKPSWSNSESSDMISVPGEGVVEDEMAALQKPAALPPVRSKSLLSSSKSLELMNAQSQGLMTGASFASGPEATAQFPTAPQVPRATKVLEEYDVREDENEDADDYRTTKMQETKTREELERQQKGDVEAVKLTAHEQPKIVVRKLTLAGKTQHVSKAVVQEAEKTEEPPGDAKMLKQCMAYAGWVKSQGSQGPALVRMWKQTCMPAVMSGKAPAVYSNMCNALGTAVQKFAMKPWKPFDICKAVLGVFKESGVGASPLR